MIAAALLLWLAAVAGLYFWILLVVAVLRPRTCPMTMDQSMPPVAPQPAPAAVNWDRWIAIAVWVMTAILAYRANQPIPQPPAASDQKPTVILLNVSPTPMNAVAQP